MQSASSQTATNAVAAGATPPGRLTLRLLAGLGRIDLSSPRATYVLRSILAAWLALVVAYALELEMPYSAASTVLLVINPIQGAVIGKGTWRVLGTLGGMAVSVLLMSAFGQMPWLFLLGFGLWLGLCVAGMTLLRHFRASGVVVAGYTVGLATFGALQHPQLTFEHVIGRGSTVMIGVVCLGLVSALFSRRSVRSKLEGLLGRLSANVAEALASQHAAAVSGADGTRAATPTIAPARRQLMAEIYGIDDLLALGKAESSDLAHRADAVRHAMASLFAALAGGVLPTGGERDASQQWRDMPSMLATAWREAGQAVATGATGLPRAVDILRTARARLSATLEAPSGITPSTSPALHIAVDRLIEQIDDYLAALEGLASLRRTRPRTASRHVPPVPPVHFHRDVRAAWQNGLRAMLTLVCTGAFWIVTGWPHGDMMLLIVAPYCALLATAPNPAAGALQFVKGTVIAVPAAFVCAFVVLPHIEGLPLLLVVLALFWLPGIYATTMPQHGLAALAYLVGFNTLTGADNPMHYDVALFLNWSIAWVLGTLFAWMGFRLFLPRQLPRDIARLRARIRDEAVKLLRVGSLAATSHNSHVWQRRQQHRIAQLGALLKTQPDAMDRAIADALASLHLGREIHRLRAWLQRKGGDALCRQIIATALARMARRADDPSRSARHARDAARRLSVAHVEAASVTGVQAALTDIADLLDAHASYFSTLPPVRTHAQ
ncbi:p-hydroxybenzoic acid efflux pump subunit AaeB [Pandoraea iniqua]|uniref:FUSC family protein n=1 Tax=Pandoraea iniqua TaxID=2508288 RepID=UPI0012585288|nr:FUSC family protein [Pandoraea iniqua]VVE33568.1 p-hydroxybenzoic acid efflux pump subunit AaeB [Pandoraea iniqua]